MADYARMRRNMVDNQLRPNRVEDPRILEAMGAVPREVFLPKQLQGIAYMDDDIRLPDGAFLIEPMALGRILQAADLGTEDVVLLAGCTTGYAAAVLSGLVGTVFVLLDDAERAAAVQERLDELDCDNVVVTSTGDIAAGCPEQAPFDVAVLLGEVPDVPQPFLDQLGAGGRLVAVVEHGRVGRLTRFTRVGETFGSRVVCDLATPALGALARAPAFTF